MAFLQGRHSAQGSSYFDPLISMRRGEISRFYMTDQVGSVRNLTNSAENVTDAYAYDAFGNIVASSGSTVNPYKYVGALGYYTNTSTPLLHVGARYYGPEVGRFIQPDPKGYESDPNLYSYVYQRPTSLADPEGLGFWDWRGWPWNWPRRRPQQPSGGGRGRKPRTRPAARPPSPGGPGASCPGEDAAVKWAKKTGYDLAWRIAKESTEEDLEGLKRLVWAGQTIAGLPENCKNAIDVCLQGLDQVWDTTRSFENVYPVCVHCCQAITKATGLHAGLMLQACQYGCRKGFPEPVQPNNPNRPRLNP